MIFLGIFIGFVSIIALTMYIKINQNADKILDNEIEEVDLKEVEDGLYEGEYYSEGIGLIVHVEVKNHEIISIEYENHQYGQGYKAEAIKESIIHSQSVLVDDVSGATNSSLCIKLAIIDALKEA